MGLFANIKTFFSLNGAIKKVQKEIKENKEIVEKIKEEIDKIITSLNVLKELVPQVAHFIESIIDIFKGIIK